MARTLLCAACVAAALLCAARAAVVDAARSGVVEDVEHAEMRRSPPVGDLQDADQAEVRSDDGRHVDLARQRAINRRLAGRLRHLEADNTALAARAAQEQLSAADLRAKLRRTADEQRVAAASLVAQTRRFVAGEAERAHLKRELRAREREAWNPSIGRWIARRFENLLSMYEPRKEIARKLAGHVNRAFEDARGNVENLEESVESYIADSIGRPSRPAVGTLFATLVLIPAAVVWVLLSRLTRALTTFHCILLTHVFNATVCVVLLIASMWFSKDPLVVLHRSCPFWYVLFMLGLNFQALVVLCMLFFSFDKPKRSVQKRILLSQLVIYFALVMHVLFVTHPRVVSDMQGSDITDRVSYFLYLVTCSVLTWHIVILGEEFPDEDYKGDFGVLARPAMGKGAFLDTLIKSSARSYASPKRVVTTSHLREL